ncbi:EAL domain-containing protein [Salinispirillum sp. LH 10-3-1]|uniref:cyclic-guanylate-specific phosphodiesterase n=1 Tax=Salinispirillum sp. LH 10-3-1 TaxID=2952525 RepID=A0AB38YJU8_9GAMM
MTMKLGHHIAVKLALVSVLVALVLGLVLGAVQSLVDYRAERERIDQTIESLLQAYEPAAARAIYNLDTLLAEEVTNGLMTYDFVTRSLVVDELGNELASRERSVATRTDPSGMRRLIPTEQSPYSIAINIAGAESTGTLILEIDPLIALEPFVQRSGTGLRLAILRTMMIVAALFLAAHWMVTRPLTILSQRFRDVDPTVETLEALHIPHHKEDELGVLTDSANRFVKTVQNLLVERDRAEKSSQAAYENIRELVDHLPQIIYVVNHEHRLMVVNRAFAALFGRKPTDLDQAPVTSLQGYVSANIWHKLFDPDQLVLAKQEALQIAEQTIVGRDGRERVFECQKFPLDYRGESAVLSVSIDITERRQAAKHIQHLAYHDSLTGLPNRNYLLEHLDQIQAQAADAHEHGALIFVDLDNFKNINDSLGHAAGDFVLCEVSRRLVAHAQDQDTVSRLGSDEFVLCIPNISHRGKEALFHAEFRANVIRELVAAPFWFDNQRLNVTASIGIAVFPDAELAATDLLRNADIAMVTAKNLGKNTCQVFQPSMSEEASRRLALETGLRQAIEENQFFLTYQPQVDVSTGEITGAEVLLRWKHPERGIVSPLEFIPTLESTGLIVQVGRWVLDTACRDLAQWVTDGLWHPGMRLGVNVSARQFAQADFIHQVRHSTEEHGISPSYLDMEITESMLIEQMKETVERMQQLRDYGVFFSIDDFGTGYSSLAYLKRLPIDVIKIDQSFIRDITDDVNDAAIVETILAIARHMKLHTVAEGVETEQQLTFLKANGCQRYQGYYFSRPVVVEDMTALLQNQPVTPHRQTGTTA